MLGFAGPMVTAAAVNVFRKRLVRARMALGDVVMGRGGMSNSAHCVYIIIFITVITSTTEFFLIALNTDAFERLEYIPFTVSFVILVLNFFEAQFFSGEAAAALARELTWRIGFKLKKKMKEITMFHCFRYMYNSTVLDLFF